MNTLKFLAFFKGYITYIFQVPVKHYLSTDIVLITQNLRKKIRQGKRYFKGTSILLKKRCKISAQNLQKKADSSGSLRVLFECPSTLRRTSVASASGRTRSAVEAVPKPSRSVREHVSNMSRRSPDVLSKATRRVGKALPSSDFCLTNFAPSSAFHAIGIEFSSGFHRATPIKTRCGLDENPMKCKNSAGIGRIMLYCIAVVFQSSNFSFKVLKSIRALALLALLVSMFSLSAQTPRKDSGADGLSSLVALKPGDRIPDAVWNQSLELNYFNGKKKTIKFADLKGKLILLDFWATWCPSCIEGFPHLEDVLAINKDEIAVLLVNSTQTKDTQKRVQDLKKKYKTAYGFQTSLPYLFGDTIFQQLFPHNAIPHVVWINKDGILVANTYANALSKENITAVLHTGNADFHQKKMRTNKEVALITNEMLNNGFYAGSVFQTYQEGLDASSGNYSFDGKRTRYQLLNLRFSQLVALAFQKELKGIPWRHWQFATSSGVDSKQRLLTPNRYENSFCYEMVVLDSLPKSRARQFFTEDFKKFFGIKLSVENKPTDVWRVSFNSAAEKVRSKGGIPEVFLGDSQTEMKFRNIPLELLVDNLSLYFHRPLVIGASKEVLVDMTIPKDFEGWEEDTRKAFLRAMGLELNSAQETIACASFSLTDR